MLRIKKIESVQVMNDFSLYLQRLRKYKWHDNIKNYCLQKKLSVTIEFYNYVENQHRNLTKTPYQFRNKLN